MSDLYTRKAQPVDTDVTKGDSWSMSILIKDKTTGVPEDVSTYTYALEVRRKTDAALIATATVDMSGAASGVVGFSISAGDVANMDPLVAYVYDVEQTNGADIQTLFGGRFSVFPDVTA